MTDEEIRTDNTETLKNALERIAELEKAKDIIKDLIRFQPYIDKEMIFHSIGNEWKIAVLKAREFLSSLENLNK